MGSGKVVRSQRPSVESSCPEARCQRAYALFGSDPSVAALLVVTLHSVVSVLKSVLVV